MTTHKLIAEMDRMLSADKREQLERLDELHKLLKKLRDRRDALKQELEQAVDETERQTIHEKIEVLKMQRKKGLAIWQELSGAKPDENAE